VCGFGIGWSPEEYAAAGVPMAQRGARLDECLDILHELWTADPAEYRGRHWSLPASHAALKPARRPPVYLAGFAPAALGRVARRADGWLPACLPGAGTFDPAAAISLPLRRIRELAAEQGRDPATIGAVLRANPTADATVERIVADLARARDEAGVEHAFVDLMMLAESTEHAAELAERILTLAR
jgi:alkanesulfonate monooxygenase SsuD/methylene tetrahydromethanopterin reductase-like flavin-dependent oxidoreductase (luciferase family)